MPRSRILSLPAKLILPALTPLLTIVPVAAQTLRVSTSGVDSNSGYAWGSSLRTLREALSRAAVDVSITRVEIAAGIYKPGGSRSAAFELRSGLTIVGGYPVAGGPAPDGEANATILSGDIGVDGDPSDNCLSVLLALGVHDVRLEGLRIRGGYADMVTTGGGPWTYGGGIYAQNSTLQFVDCRFVDNYARFGGAVGMFSTSVSFTGCRFVGNSALAGGAIANLVYATESDVLIDRCRFLGNRAADYGGAVWNYSRLSAYDSEFSGNHCSGLGGAICCVTQAHQTRVSNCSLTNNEASVGGGAFYAFDPGVVVLVNSIFWNDLGGGSPTEIAPSGVFAHHCCVMGLAACALSGYSNFDLDPLLVDPLGIDGVAGTIDDDLHLRRGSACVQAGDNTAVPIFAMRDIDDQDRIQMPVPWSTAIVDLGADEVGMELVLFPGSAPLFDLDLELFVSGHADGIDGTDAMSIPGGSRLEARVVSPNGSAVGLPGALTIDLFAGPSAPNLPGLPGAWFGPGAVVFVFAALPPQGLPVVIDPIPYGLVASLMLQGHSLRPTALNGLFDSTRGRELRPH